MDSQKMVKKLLLILLIINTIFITKANADNYKLPSDSEYYLEINKDKYLNTNTLDKVKTQVLGQYQGSLKIKNSRPIFNKYEYGFVFKAGWDFNSIRTDKFNNGATELKTDYDTIQNNFAVGAGLFWSNNYRVELEWQRDYKQLKNKDDKDINFNTLMLNFTWDYYRYNAKLFPYLIVGIGAIQASSRMNSEYLTKIVPAFNVAIGLEYKYDPNYSFFIQAKYLNNIQEIELKQGINTIKLNYNTYSIGLGLRFYYM